MQTDRFTTLNHEIIEKFPELTGSAVKVYHVLASYLPSAVFPKIKMIAQRAGCSQATVFRSLKMLEKHNIIKRIRNYKLPNIYKFNVNILPGKLGMLHQMATAKTRKLFGLLMAKMGIRDAGRQSKSAERYLEQVNTKNIREIFNFNGIKKMGMQPLAMAFV